MTNFSQPMNPVPWELKQFQWADVPRLGFWILRSFADSAGGCRKVHSRRIDSPILIIAPTTAEANSCDDSQPEFLSACGLCPCQKTDSLSPSVFPCRIPDTIMLGALLSLFFIGLLLCAFLFSKTTKEFPKSWFEWKTEFRYQYLGIVGLIHDAQHAARDRVGKYSYIYFTSRCVNCCHYPLSIKHFTNNPIASLSSPEATAASDYGSWRSCWPATWLSSWVSWPIRALPATCFFPRDCLSIPQTFEQGECAAVHVPGMAECRVPSRKEIESRIIAMQIHLSASPVASIRSGKRDPYARNSLDNQVSLSVSIASGFWGEFSR